MVFVIVVAHKQTTITERPANTHLQRRQRRRFFNVRE
jgi:hypothetical protein